MCLELFIWVQWWNNTFLLALNFLLKINTVCQKKKHFSPHQSQPQFSDDCGLINWTNWTHKLLTKEKKKQSFRLFFNFIGHKGSLNLVTEKCSIKSNNGFNLFNASHMLLFGKIETATCIDHCYETAKIVILNTTSTTRK